MATEGSSEAETSEAAAFRDALAAGRPAWSERLLKGLSEGSLMQRALTCEIWNQLLSKHTEKSTAYPGDVPKLCTSALKSAQALIEAPVDAAKKVGSP